MLHKTFNFDPKALQILQELDGAPMDVVLVKMYRDGNQTCALIGSDLMEGMAGFGETQGAALRALADALEVDPTDEVVESNSTVDARMERTYGAAAGSTARTATGGGTGAPGTCLPVAGANDRQVGGAHYKTKMEHWDYVLANDIPYLEAQIIKYLTRWRKKNGLEDVHKARHFLDKLLEHETAKQTMVNVDVTRKMCYCNGSTHERAAGCP